VTLNLRSRDIKDTIVMDKIKCGCGKKARLIIACKDCCPSENFEEYKEVDLEEKESNGK